MISPLPPQDADKLLGEFFSPGVEAADLPALFPLLRARDALDAFTTLFRGGSDETLVRIMVLREIGARSESPRWSPQELRAYFAYLDPVKLETVLHRLRDNGLLVWNGEDGLYQVSGPGRTALAALATLLQFAEEEDGELGFITSQVAAGQAVGKVSAESLRHLLGRLNELQEEFQQAIVSGSEFRIRQSQDKLNSVWQWVEKGTEIIRAIAADPDLDPATHRVAQAIGQAQSRMLRMTASFQRAVNGLERQRVHLGQSGLSSSDINQWLRTTPPGELAALLRDVATAHPEPLFLLNDILLDIAEYELLERERRLEREAVLPPALQAPQTDSAETERLVLLERWLEQLAGVETAAELADIVPGGDYATAAYRLSMLALLNEPEPARTGPVAELARLPLRLEIDPGAAAVGRDEVAQISGGRVVRNADGA